MTRMSLNGHSCSVVSGGVNVRSSVEGNSGTIRERVARGRCDVTIVSSIVEYRLRC